MGVRFGTDGVRGPAGRFPVDAEGAARVGAVAARWAGRGRSVWVGWDRRPSGADLAARVRAAATRGGAVGRDAGVIPSAGLAATVAAEPGAVGVMVTASHNPAADNGFKLLGPGGHKPDDAATAWLEAALAAPAPAVRPAGPRSADRDEAWRRYVQAFSRAVGGSAGLAGRRLVLDLAHGAATAWMAREGALGALLPGVDLEVLGGGDGVVNDGVGSEHPGALAEAVVAAGAWAGIAVDGDADRCVLVDASGAVVPGDAVAWLLARGEGHASVALTVMSCAAVAEALPGVRVLETPVGDRHLAAALRAGRATFGAEPSGHVLFADGLPGGDGLLTGLRALRVAARCGGSLSTAWRRLRLWPRALTKVRATDRRPVSALPGVAPFREALAAGGGGRVFLRWSGTEPVLRVLVEGPDAATVERVGAGLTAHLAGVLKEA